MAGHESGACDMQQASILDYRDPAGNLCVCVCADDDEEKKRLIPRSTIIEAELFPRIRRSLWLPELLQSRSGALKV